MNCRCCKRDGLPWEDRLRRFLPWAGNHQITVYSCTGPTEGDLDPETNLWLVDEAPEQWAKIMTEVKAGRDPSKAMERTETADGAVKVGSSDIIEVGTEESSDAIEEDAEE